MPWSEVSPMDRRLQFIAEYNTGLYSMTELAAAYGISRRIAYYWADLYEREGPARLAGASRRPHHSPTATPPTIIAQVIAARQAHPTWGAGKLRAFLRRQQPEQGWPCRDTMHEILRRAGAVRQRRRRHPALHPPTSLTTPQAPNELWTVDYKGEFRTRDGHWCYPLTVRDAYSRFVLRCRALATHTRLVTQREFLYLFRQFGLPVRIRSDNGPPFGSHGLARLSRLVVWWLRLGILPERITPGHPEQNGAHEQFHAVLKRETTCPPAGSRDAQQRWFTRFTAEYNGIRPHAALDGASPAMRYEPSPRPYPETLPALEYLSEWTVRRVSSQGSIKWQGRALFVSHALADEHVALEPIDDGVWLLRFAALPLARFDERRWHLLSLLSASVPSAHPHG